MAFLQLDVSQVGSLSYDRPYDDDAKLKAPCEKRYNIVALRFRYQYSNLYMWASVSFGF